MNIFWTCLCILGVLGMYVGCGLIISVLVGGTPVNKAKKKKVLGLTILIVSFIIFVASIIIIKT